MAQRQRISRSFTRRKVPLGSTFAEGRAGRVNSRTAENLIPRPEDPLARERIVFYPTPGLTLYTASGSGVGCRGNGVVFQSKGYMVFGDALVEIDSTGTATTVGTLATTSGRVSMAPGFAQLAIVDGSYLYVFDGATLTTVASPTFGVADYITWVDQYFVVVKKGTGRFYISGLDDATAWDALEFAIAERRADNAVVPIEFRGDLLIIGENTTELYYNSANVTFPWEAYPNTVFEFGTPAGASVARERDFCYMLATTREGGYAVFRFANERPEKISTFDIDNIIAGFTTISDAEGFCYNEGGQAFYMLTFPTEKRTFCFDGITMMWHERTNFTEGRHLAGGYLQFGGKHLVGAFDHGDIYTFDNEGFTDDGVTIRRRLRTPQIHFGTRRVFVTRLELIMEGGTALTSGQGSSPQVAMRYSDDGGHTWSNELWRSMGKKGEYNKRIVWHNLGQTRERTFEFTITDPVETIFISLHADGVLGVD